MKYLLTILVIITALAVKAQIYAVQGVFQIIPPYSPHLTDYTAPGAQKLMLQLRFVDPNEHGYQVKLRVTIDGVGITLRTKATYIPQPINLQGGGVPQLFYGEDLADYLNPNNLDFSGLSRKDYDKTNTLPEGVYRFTIEVLDYNRSTVVSNKITTVAWVILNDPPLLNLPRKDVKIQIIDPVNIPFTWTPRQTGSPNSAFTTEYTFRLVEIWPADRNPYDAFLSQPTLYETTTSQTQIVYTMAEPALIPGRKYAWQIQAKDTEGRDLFKNQGMSEVYAFQYGDVLGVPEDLSSNDASAATLSLKWQPASLGEMPLSYRVRYRQQGTDTWYESATDQRWATLASLNAATTYEVQVRAEASPQVSDYTVSQFYATQDPGSGQFTCGAPANQPPIQNTHPLLLLSPGDVITAMNFKVVVTTAKGSAGNYSGEGIMQVPMFSGASVRVIFSGTINDQREMLLGDVTTVYNKGSAMAQVVDEMQKIGEKKPTPAAKDSTAAPITYTIAGTIDSVYVNDAGKIIVTDTEGKQTTYDQPLVAGTITGEKQPVAITDGAGNTYTVDKNGKVSETSAAQASNPTIAPDSIKDKIIVLILNQFTEEITSWLKVNGKGSGEEDRDILLAAELPDVFFKDEAYLELLRDNVVSYYDTHPEELRAAIEEDDSNKTLLDDIKNIFKNGDDVDWTKISKEDQDAMINATAASLVELFGGEINLADLTDLVPECGAKYAGKDKPVGALLLINYPANCSYILEGVVTMYVSKGYSKYLCAKERFDLIKCLSTGIVLGAEEDAIITLFTESPKAQATDLLTFLTNDASGLLKNINAGFQGDNYVRVFKAIRQIYLSASSKTSIDADAENIDKAFFSDSTRAQKAQQNAFTWFEGGILKSLFSDDYAFSRFDNLVISDGGVVSFNYATSPEQQDETTTPVSLYPFELIGIRLKGGSSGILDASEGTLVYVPAIMLPVLVSKKQTSDLIDALNATAVATGLGSIITGATRYALVTGGIDVLLGGSALVVDSYKDDILSMDNGSGFLDAYVLVNNAFLTYFGTKAIVQVVVALPKLAAIFNTFKNSDDYAKLKTTNSSKAGEIEQEVEEVLAKGDDLIKKAGRIIAKSGSELKEYLDGIVNKPSGRTYKGSFFKSVSKKSETLYNAKPDVISEYSIEEAWGRYDMPKESGMYYSESLEGNQTEMSYYSDWNGFSTYEYEKVQIDNMLDLTDDLIRQQLATEFDQLVLGMADKSQAYEFTNVIGTWARERGYKGLIAPGARGNQDYINIVVFSQQDIDAVLGNINPNKLK